MKRRLFVSTLKERMKGIIESYQVKRNLWGFKDDEDLIVAMENIYEELTDNDSMLNIVKLTQFYYLYQYDVRINDYVYTLGEPLQDLCKADNVVYGFEQLSQVIFHPIFKDGPCVRALCQEEKNFFGKVAALYEFQKLKILSREYFYLILEMDAFNELRGYSFAWLMANFVNAGIKFEKENIYCLAENRNVLINAIINAPVKNADDRLRVERIDKQMQEIIRGLVEHKMLTAEILNYLYASHIKFAALPMGPQELGIRMRARQVKEQGVRLKILNSKLNSLISLNKVIPHLDVRWLSKIINHHNLAMQTVNLVEEVPALVSKQMDIIKNEYYFRVCRLLMPAMRSEKDSFSILPNEVVHLILIAYCNLHERKYFPVWSLFGKKSVSEKSDLKINFRK